MTHTPPGNRTTYGPGTPHGVVAPYIVDRGGHLPMPSQGLWQDVTAAKTRRGFFGSYYVDELRRATPTTDPWTLPAYTWSPDIPPPCPLTDTQRIERLFKPQTPQQLQQRVDDLSQAFKNATEALSRSNQHLADLRDDSRRARGLTALQLTELNNLRAAQPANHAAILKLQDTVTEATTDRDRAQSLLAMKQADYNDLRKQHTELLDMFARVQEELDGMKLDEYRRTRILPADPFDEL